LALWNHDTNLDEALRLGKLILNITDVMNELWPCPGMSWYEILIVGVNVDVSSCS